MKAWGLVMGAVLMVACGGSGAAPLASGSPPSVAATTPSPAPSPVQPIVLKGTNSKVTDPMEIPPGTYRVNWQATDTEKIGGTTVSELFEVYVQGQDKTNIVNEVLPNPSSGEALFTSSGGSFIINVDVSSATWHLTFTWLSP